MNWICSSLPVTGCCSVAWHTFIFVEGVLHSILSPYLVSRSCEQTSVSCKVNQSTALHYKYLPDDETMITSNESIRTKRNKLRSSKRKSRKISYKESATREELAYHVQSVFSESLGDMLLMDSDDLNDVDEMTKKLQRHPSLVLNADYQVCLRLKVIYFECWLLGAH